MNKTEAALAIQVLPETENQTEMLLVIDKVIANIKSKGLNCQVGAFETTVDGDLDQLLAIIKESLAICVEAGAESVMSYIKINYSPKGVLSIAEKVTKHQ